MKNIWKVLGISALMAGLIPYKAEENLETGEKTYDALLWQVRTCPDPETGRPEVVAVSILPNHLARQKRREAAMFNNDDLCYPKGIIIEENENPVGDSPF